jgi:hypothetical protein
MLICGLLSLGAGPASAPAVSPAEPDAATLEPPSKDEPVIVRPIAAPLPSAGVGGLALLSLMMLRRWFRQRI